MLALRVGQSLLLGSLALVVWVRAYFASATAASVDDRVPWALPLIVAALVGGHLLARFVASRSGQRGDGPGLDGHLLLLVLAGLGLQAQSHVAPETTLRALREEIPAALAWVHPGLVFLAPVLLARLRRRLDGADVLLVSTLALTSLSGAIHLLDGAGGLTLALATLLAQLAAGDGRLGRGPLLGLAIALAGLMTAATWAGENPLHARPAYTWFLTGTTLLAAVGARARSRADIQLLLGAPLAAAVLLALCGAVVTASLAAELHWKPALATRLVLFRQHPNFLAPFFAFQAVVALGLALGGVRGRPLYGAACLLLAASAWLTDSRAGQALLLIGLVGTPAVLGLRRLSTRVSTRTLRGGLLAAAALLVVGLVGAQLSGKLGAGVDRFEKSMEYRVDAWSNAWAVVERWPLLGIGPHTFLSLERFAPGSRFFNEPTSPHPHNVLLYVAQSAGLPALLLFLAMLAALARGLWCWVRDGDGSGRVTAAALLAALLALLAANQLDVGLALDSVVPEPMFLLIGLVLAGRPRPERPPLRAGPGLLWSVGAVALAVPLGLAPLRAAGHVEQAGLLAYMAGQSGDREGTMARARQAGERALATDPLREETYELLARWVENAPGGFSRAREVLLQLVRMAPGYGRGHALLGQLYVRARMHAEAARELALAVEDGHGSVHQSRDRAALVTTLCQLGRRDEALDQLVEALHLDVGVIDQLRWQPAPDGSLLLGVPGQRPLALIDAVEILFGRHVAEEQAGRPVGRRNWMDTYRAFRKAGRDDRAAFVLDHLEAHVPAVERWTITHERGLLALDDDRCEEAQAHIQAALDMTGNPFYASELTRARRLCGEEVDEQPGGRPALLSELVEILDQAEVFEHALRTRSEVLVADDRHAEAAAALRPLLMFVDDPLERAERWLEVARLARAGDDPAAAVDACREALECAGAKPYPAALLQRERTTSLPLQVAETLLSAWRDQGLDDRGLLEAAWSLPGYFSARVSWCQLRSALFRETGQMDALLREARMARMDDGQDLLARWLEIEALEGLGRHRQAADAMRDLSELFRRISPVPVERLHAQLVRDGQQRLEDPRAWRDVAVVEMLRGRFEEAAGLFVQAAELVSEVDPREAAALMAWSARALLFSGGEGALPGARAALSRACRLAPRVGSHRRRLETLP